MARAVYHNLHGSNNVGINPVDDLASYCYRVFNKDMKDHFKSIKDNFFENMNLLKTKINCLLEPSSRVVLDSMDILNLVTLYSGLNSYISDSNDEVNDLRCRISKCFMDLVEDELAVSDDIEFTDDELLFASIYNAVKNTRLFDKSEFYDLGEKLVYLIKNDLCLIELNNNNTYFCRGVKAVPIYNVLKNNNLCDEVKLDELKNKIVGFFEKDINLLEVYLRTSSRNKPFVRDPLMLKYKLIKAFSEFKNAEGVMSNLKLGSFNYR